MEFQLITPVLIRTSSEPAKISASEFPVHRCNDDLVVEYNQYLDKPDFLFTSTASTTESICMIEQEKTTVPSTESVDVQSQSLIIDFETKMKEKFEANLIDRVNHTRAKCAVCLVMYEENFTCVACTNEKCSTNVCQSCLFNYVSTAVKDAQYTMPPIRCIGCKCQIPTPTWVTCLRTMKSDLETCAVESKIMDIMQTCKILSNLSLPKRSVDINNGYAFLSLRCASCDQTFPLVGEHTPSADQILSEMTSWSPDPAFEKALSNFKQRETVTELMLQYILGEVTLFVFSFGLKYANRFSRTSLWMRLKKSY